MEIYQLHQQSIIPIIAQCWISIMNNKRREKEQSALRIRWFFFVFFCRPVVFLASQIEQTKKKKRKQEVQTEFTVNNAIIQIGFSFILLHVDEQSNIDFSRSVVKEYFFFFLLSVLFWRWKEIISNKSTSSHSSFSFLVWLFFSWSLISISSMHLHLHPSILRYRWTEVR